MLGAVSAGALSNLWVWLQRRSDTLHLWTAGWCAITGLYLISHYVQLTSEVLGLVVLLGVGPDDDEATADELGLLFPEIERRIDQYAANPHPEPVRVAAE